MLQLRVDELLKERNKSIYWLSSETDITYPSMLKIVKRQTNAIKLDNLANICKALNCSPAELFEEVN